MFDSAPSPNFLKRMMPGQDMPGMAPPIQGGPPIDGPPPMMGGMEVMPKIMPMGPPMDGPPMAPPPMPLNPMQPPAMPQPSPMMPMMGRTPMNQGPGIMGMNRGQGKKVGLMNRISGMTKPNVKKVS